MTAIATDASRVTAAGPLARRRRHGAGPSTGGSAPARAGGVIGLVLVALVVVGAVGVVGSSSGYGADPGTGAGGSEPVAAGGQAGEAMGGGAAATVTLGEGETAWEALRSHAPDGVRHEVFVHEVVRANGVDARELRPGDVLVVPREAR